MSIDGKIKEEVYRTFGYVGICLAYVWQKIQPLEKQVSKLKGNIVDS